MDHNRARYSSSEVVRHFANKVGLQKPEQTIFRILEPRLPATKMLDVGVGGGRTTEHFSHRVAEYTAMDYSPELIECCRRKYPGARFITGDARSDLRLLADGAFDLVLFSFNGIDNLSYDERLRLLADVRRVCARGGHFCFSTHNVQCIEELRTRKLPLDPRSLAHALLHRGRFLKRNRDAFRRARDADFVVLHDDLYDLDFDLGYIRPWHQIDLLEQAGFEQTRVFDLAEGRELSTMQRVADSRDAWLYYLSR
jgi:SAM-dependent methyltransferase